MSGRLRGEGQPELLGDQTIYRSLRRDDDRYEDAARLRSWQFVLGQVGRLYGQEPAPEAALVLWAFLHGMTVLQRAGVFGKLKPESSFKVGLQMWIDAAAC